METGRKSRLFIGLNKTAPSPLLSSSPPPSSTDAEPGQEVRLEPALQVGFLRTRTKAGREVQVHKTPETRDCKL